MISHEYGCVFIHIPKCAGTSIEKALGHYAEADTMYGGKDHRPVRMIEAPITPSALAPVRGNWAMLVQRLRWRWREHGNPRNRASLTPAQFARYLKFTIVRNPWDRLVSAYKGILRDSRLRPRYGVGSDTPFSEVVHRNAGRGLFQPQLYWLRSFRGDVPMDFIGRFENLRRDFDYVRQQLALDTSSALPHEIPGGGADEDYRRWYDDTTAEFVARYYHEEIAYFGYRF